MIRKRMRRTGFGILVILILLFITFPFIYMVLSSLKQNVDLFNLEKVFFFKPTSQNYRDVFIRYNFINPLKNTTIVTVSATLLSLIFGVPAAYVIARYRMTIMSTVILAVRIIPFISFLVPWYLIFSKIGLTGTYTSLILCHMIIGLPYIIWIMIPYFEKLPQEIVESAIIDGCYYYEAFLKIMLPLSVPGIITSTILVFIASWNNFIFGLILGTGNTQPLPIAIFSFISYTEVNWGGLMAASVVVTIPIILVTMILQRYIIAGLTAGAVKG